MSCSLPRTCRLECAHRPGKHSTKAENEDDVDGFVTKPPSASILTTSKLSPAEAHEESEEGSCMQTCCSRVQTSVFPSPIIVQNESFAVLYWSNAVTDDASNETTLFHVERRLDDSSTWQEVLETFEKFHTFSTDEIRHKYRIWATNSTAFVGISLDSIKEDEEEEQEEEEEEDGGASAAAASPASPPPPPYNLTEGDTLLSDGNISVFISWSPPKHSNPPISKYNIIWTKKSSYYEPRSSNRRSVPSSQHNFQLHNLEQGASYLVQVQAVSKLGKKRLKSSKSSIVITTYPVPFAPFVEEHLFILSSPSPTHHHRHHHHHHHHNHHHHYHSVDKHQNIPLVVNMTLGRPYYESANLKVALHWNSSLNVTSHSYLVTWYPDACIVDDSSKMQKQRNFLPNTLTLVAENQSAVLHSLNVNCRYTARVEVNGRRLPLSSEEGQGRGGDDESKLRGDSDGGIGSSQPSNQISFATPSCGKSKNTNTIENQLCINTDILLPDKVGNLEYRFLISGSNNVTCRVSWTSPISQSQIVGYKISWIPISSKFPMDEVFSKVNGDEHPFLKTLFNDEDFNDGYDDDDDDDKDEEDDEDEDGDGVDDHGGENAIKNNGRGDDDDDDDDGDQGGKSGHERTNDGARKKSSFLDHSARRFDIGDLLVETTYALRIRAVSSEGAGRASYIHFTTPHLQTAPGKWRGNSGRKENIHKYQQADVSTHRVKSFMRDASSASSSSSFHSLSPSSVILLRIFLLINLVSKKIKAIVTDPLLVVLVTGCCCRCCCTSVGQLLCFRQTFIIIVIITRPFF